MGSLDAHKNEIFTQLVNGDWKSLFPRQVYAKLSNWFKRQKSETLVNVRFLFEAGEQRVPYAVYLVCEPKFEKGKVDVRSMKVGEEGYPLAIPPSLYNMPLYCMPKDLLIRITKKKK